VGYDPVFSFRMPASVRRDLRQAAHRNGDCAASLVLKIITDYLNQRTVSSRVERSSEKRNHGRRKLVSPVPCSLLAAGDTQVFILRDLSAGGMYLEGAQPLRLSNSLDQRGFPQVEVCLRHPSIPDGLQIPSRVTRLLLNPPAVGVGLEFLDLSDTNRTILEDFFLRNP